MWTRSYGAAGAKYGMKQKREASRSRATGISGTPAAMTSRVTSPLAILARRKRDGKMMKLTGSFTGEEMSLSQDGTENETPALLGLPALETIHA